MSAAEQLGERAQKVGILGAVVLILAAGVALRIGKIAEVFRLLVKDLLDHSLKRKQLDYQISIDTEKTRLEIEKKMPKLRPRTKEPK
jgi:hypothetical protein